MADRQVLAHRDPERLQLVARTDPREHQQHGRLVRAGGDDHLALGADGLAGAVLHELDADRAVALEHDPLDEDAGRDLEVRPALGGVEERVGGAAPQAVALRELEAGDALGPVDVEVVDVLVARLHRRLELGIDQGLIERPSETASGPPTPWNSSSPRSLSSERLKYGSTSSYDQPVAPPAAQSS